MLLIQRTNPLFKKQVKIPGYESVIRYLPVHEPGYSCKRLKVLSLP